MRIVKWLVLLLVLALLVVVGLVARKASNAMEPVTLQTLVLNDTDPDALVDDVEGTQVTLLVGVDRRKPPPDGLADATADPRGPAVAQMISLVQTIPNRDTTAVVTFPLDLVVLPVGQANQMRLDRVQARGGPDALLATIQTLTGIRIDHYVEVDLRGVVGWVDAVGGVQVCLDEALQPPPQPTGSASPSAESPSGPASPASNGGQGPDNNGNGGDNDGDGAGGDGNNNGNNNGNNDGGGGGGNNGGGGDGSNDGNNGNNGNNGNGGDGNASDGPSGDASPEGVPSGCQLLDGAAAAGFLASRSDPSRQVDVQRTRIAEQHYLLSKVLERTQLSTVLLNPMRVNRVLDSLDAAVATDLDPGMRGMLDLGDSIAGFDRTSLQVRVVPSYKRSEDGETLLYPDQATALFDALRSGDSLADVGQVTGDELGPEDVTVLVVNGVGTPGLAGSAAQYLTSRGFEVACAVNPSDLDPRATFDPEQVDIVVAHTSDFAVETELLTEALGDLPVQVQEAERLPPMPSNSECSFNDDGTVDAVMTVGTGWPQ